MHYGVLHRKISVGRELRKCARVLERFLRLYRTFQKRMLEFIRFLKDFLPPRIIPSLTPQ